MEGYWFDPKHGGCLRLVSRGGEGAYVIHGAYGDDEPPAYAGEYWHAVARADPHTRGALIVDFVGKPFKRRTRYRARLEGRSLHWDDGNVWRKAYTTPRLFATRDTWIRTDRPGRAFALFVFGPSLVLLALRGPPAVGTPWARAWLAGMGSLLIAWELAWCTFAETERVVRK